MWACGARAAPDNQLLNATSSEVSVNDTAIISEVRRASLTDSIGQYRLQTYEATR
jgi:hypothetical protein